MRRAIVAAAGVAMAAALLAVGVPWATRDRMAVTGTPTPPPFAAVTPVRLEPGQRACQAQAALSPRTRAVVTASGGLRGGGPPLRVEIEAPGYRATGRIAPGYGGGVTLSAEVPAPPASVLARICVVNAGDRPVPLQGSTEPRMHPRPQTTVDGRPVQAKMTLLLTEGRDRSLASRPGPILDRIAAFKPWWIGRGSLAVLGALVVLGVPLLVLRALWAGGDHRD